MRPALCKSVWLQFISLAGLAEHTASIEHSCSAGKLAYKVTVLPFLCEMSSC